MREDQRPARDLGVGMAFVPELLLRQVLMEGFVELGGDDDRQRELFERLDGLLQSSRELWERDYRAMLCELALAGDRWARFTIGYPTDTARYPTVSIVNESGAEDDALAVVGGVLSVGYRTVGTPTVADDQSARMERHQVEGVGWTSNIQVGVWSVAAEESVVLSAIVKHLLLRHRGRLLAAGVHSATLSETGFIPDPARWPRTGYVPVIRCTMGGTLRQTRRRSPTEYRVRLTTLQGNNE